jgi:peptidoglycan hydrolase-like protein with peptidoglycan-binding domain
LALISRLFRSDSKLEACAVSDQAHILQGAAGEHVSKIQAALLIVNGSRIDSKELTVKLYGASTAAAVLAYKRKRRIINLAYQTQADGIVGKMTIAALDREIAQYERMAAERNYCAGSRTPQIAR